MISIMNERNKSGAIVTVVCFSLWIIGVFAMGTFALVMGAPIFFPIVTWGMGLFVTLILISIWKNKDKLVPKQQPVSGIYDPGFITYSGDSIGGDSSMQNYDRKAIYKVPSKCPSCGASLTIEEVEWIGLLKAKCPYCMAIIDTE
jgi:hypothetical protein